MKMTVGLFMHIEQFKDDINKKNEKKNDTHMHTGKINTKEYLGNNREKGTLRH